MFQVQALLYPYDALEPYIDTETMHLHHDGHYATYVKNLNDLLSTHPRLLQMTSEELITSLDLVPPEIRQKVINNNGGVSNHSFFWTIMSPDGSGQPTGETAKQINHTFGDFSKFKEQFSSTAAGIFGSGWAWLVLDQGKLVITQTQNQNTPLSDNLIPILGLDVWEHAYYLKYHNKRKDYIDAWWNVVNWAEVERRLCA